ncbi:MAG: pantetheine-phosphate adenylyltransferase [Candidatus Ancillula sp.]|jgi:pantetheine-phosphate adenylyltransferase|nr:pantetheine-phosphate adenylyltransferase [Candidatus Ancillula sp.]
MTTAVFPGTFDPFTVGHLEILKTTCKLFDEVHVLIGKNLQKDSLFSAEKREEMVRVVADVNNLKVQVSLFDGLITQYCNSHSIDAIVKGVRNFTDFEYENSQAFFNSKLGKVPTVLIPTSPEIEYVSSTSVRQLINFNADVSEYVPECILAYVTEGSNG